jgi:hypothetical protein
MSISPTPLGAAGAYEPGMAQPRVESSVSAVSWAAVFAGAAVAVAVSMILLALGSGLGLSAISPWGEESSSATALTVGAAVWLIVMQWLSSGLGGYVTGRLRTKWVDVHDEEVYFRDTAHGLLSWCVATILTVGLLVSAATGVVGSGVQAAATVGGGAAQAGATAMSGSDMGYNLDQLFRRAQPDGSASAADSQAEAGRIIANGMTTGDVPEADRAYLAQMVSARAGIPPQEARSRVDATVERVKAAAQKAKEVADAARKAASRTAFFTALSMVIGAFIACVAAALAGRQRDAY